MNPFFYRRYFSWRQRHPPHEEPVRRVSMDVGSTEEGSFVSTLSLGGHMPQERVMEYNRVACVTTM